MKKILFSILTLLLFIFLGATGGVALEVAPRISDREIVEKLSRLEEGQKNLETRVDDLRSEMSSRFESMNKQFESIDKRFESMDKRFDGLRSEMNTRFESMEKRFESIDKRFESMEKRFDDLRSDINSRFELMDKRFDDLTWIFGLFITISLVMLGFVIRMQWEMQKRQTQTDTTLQIQKDEVNFLKDMIMKLFPPKGIL